MYIGKLDISWMDDILSKFAFDLDIIKENSRSIYAEGMYGNIYRVVKSTTEVYINGKKYAEKCHYTANY